MLAAYYERTGAAREVLRLGDLPDPRPAAGQVLIQLTHSAVNPSDVRRRSGRSSGGTSRGAWKVPHQDGAGWIEAVGEGVPSTRIGEPVWVYNAAIGHDLGTAAQRLVIESEQAVAVPEGVALDEVAGLGVPFLTAFGALPKRHDLSGSTVLVTGGAGAVGSAAIQLANRAGARVVATVSSPSKAATAVRAGAAAVIDRTTADPADAIADVTEQGIDHVIDVAVHHNIRSYSARLLPHAEIVVYATESGMTPPLPVSQLMHRNAHMRFLHVYNLPSATLRLGAAVITDLLAAGLRPAIEREILPLAEIATAHERVEAASPKKQILSVPNEGRPARSKLTG